MPAYDEYQQLKEAGVALIFLILFLDLKSSILKLTLYPSSTSAILTNKPLLMLYIHTLQRTTVTSGLVVGMT